MNDELIQQLTLVRNALNNVSVSGKQNLSNLGASIDILDHIIEKIQQENVKDHYSQQDNIEM